MIWFLHRVFAGAPFFPAGLKLWKKEQKGNGYMPEEAVTLCCFYLGFTFAVTLAAVFLIYKLGRFS